MQKSSCEEDSKGVIRTGGKKIGAVGFGGDTLMEKRKMNGLSFKKMRMRKEGVGVVCWRKDDREMGRIRLIDR